MKYQLSSDFDLFGKSVLIRAPKKSSAVKNNPVIIEAQQCRLKIPTMQVRSRSIMLYELPAIQNGGRKKSLLSNFTKNAKTDNILKDANGMPVLDENGNIRLKTYSGEMTFHAKKRLSKAISLLNQSSPWRKEFNPVCGRLVDFKLAFITLTIPSRDIVPGKEGYNLLLKPFLRIMQARFKNFKYVWKAELQERGQLHYHITCNTLIEHHTISSTWNKILSQNRLLDDFIKQKGHNNAPSTEIRRVRNVKNIEAYLLKYVSKADSMGRSVGGRVWGCSSCLSASSYFSDVCTNVNEAIIDKLVSAGRVVRKVLDRCVVLEFIKGSIFDAFTPKQIILYKNFIYSLNNLSTA